MPKRFSFRIVVGSLITLALSAYAAFLILQVCALNLPFLRHLSSCTTSVEINILASLELETQRSDDLQRQIFELERELSGKQCVRPPLDPDAPLSPEGLKNRDLSVFYGCWSLETTYRTRDIDTGLIRSYSDWTMCFGGQGNGRQSMQADDGTVCNGQMTVQYSDKGFELIEPGNLECEDGGYIHQREIICAPSAEGRASCETLQPETKGEATVGFGRPKVP